MLLLLRLLDPLPSYDSSMTIDGISLARIDRSTLRRRIIAVPQDAVFLPDGTSFHTNLDPYESSTAAECQSVLEAVGLWAFVQDRGGLDAGLAGDTLSMGQKQLFSLARAMLRRRLKARALRSPSSHASGVGETDSGAEKGVAHASVGVGGLLLLDEVSSSVDLATEKAMHEVIRSEFSGYTIVMVSHRLDVVMDFDRVIVMDSGGVVESGAPRELAAVEGGRFRDLWLAAGQK
jgi:ATP-binding cassette subfamily C (CFTR/MRP) protein 1